MSVTIAKTKLAEEKPKTRFPYGHPHKYWWPFMVSWYGWPLHLWHGRNTNLTENLSNEEAIFTRQTKTGHFLVYIKLPLFLSKSKLSQSFYTLDIASVELSIEYFPSNASTSHQNCTFNKILTLHRSSSLRPLKLGESALLIPRST